MSKVSILKCESYDQRTVDQAIHQLLAPIGGMFRFVQPGQRVLIKPNVLLGKSPEDAVTTHPSIISAVIREVIKAGGLALVGDSPGNVHSKVEETMKKAGISQAVEAAGGKMVYFQQEGVELLASPCNNRFIPTIPIARAALEADVIINLAKLKTHGLTLYTGAVKNMFGTVPGFHKGTFHFRCPNPRDFAESLVDVYALTAPQLNIIDAIVGMEGRGPSDGQPRKLGLLIAASDGVSADAIGSYLIGYKPFDILTTLIAHDRHVGEGDLKNIEVLGPSLDQIKQVDWRKAPNMSGLLTKVPPWLYKFVTSFIRIDPWINQTKCTKCLICVNNCPAKAIDHLPKQKRVEIDLKDCIHCFCCHELCEYKAIELRGSWLAKIMGLC